MSVNTLNITEDRCAAAAHMVELMIFCIRQVKFHTRP
jgi:hypothetical protein